MSGAELERPPAGQVLRRTLGLLWEQGRFRLAATLALSLVQAVLPVASVWLTARTVDAVAGISTGGSDIMDAVFPLALQGLVGGLTYLLTAEQRIIQVRLSDRIGFTLRLQVLEKVERLALVQLERPATHNQLNRFHSGGVEAPLAFGQSLVGLVRSGITFVCYLAILAHSSWIAAVAAVAALVVGSALENRLARQEYGLQVGQSPLQRRREYLWRLLLRPESGKEIRVFGLGAYLREKWADLYVQLRGQDLDQIQREDRQGSLMQWLNALLLIGISGSLLIGVSRGGLTVGEYVALNGAVIATQGIARELAQSVATSLRHFVMTGDLFAFLDLPQPAPPAGGWQHLPRPLQRGISCRSLSYTYPGGTGPALQEVSLEFAPGDRVAIVGANGAGKSTLVKCLLGLYQPTHGEILYDGVDVRHVDPAELQTRVTAVFQDFTRYALSLRENIGFGNLARLVDDTALLAAGRAAGATFISQLPHGMDTLLDHTLNDEATDLSQGQWQKLALARALLSEADVVVLDEPSSALDPEAEAEIFRTFDRATRNKTVFFISHRLGSVRMANRILVMKDGRIVESGTHEELVRLGGEYARMYQAQAEWYYHTPAPAVSEAAS